MYAWFLLIFIIILLLSFTHKEGYYSNSEISAAGTSITALKKKIKDLDKSLNDLYEFKLSSNEIIAKLTPMLEGDEVAKYSNGVITGIMQSIHDFSALQKEMDEINDAIRRIKREKLFADSFVNLLNRIDALEDKLSKLP